MWTLRGLIDLDKIKSVCVSSDYEDYLRTRNLRLIIIVELCRRARIPHLTKSSLRVSSNRDL